MRGKTKDATEYLKRVAAAPSKLATDFRNAPLETGVEIANTYGGAIWALGASFDFSDDRAGTLAADYFGLELLSLGQKDSLDDYKYVAGGGYIYWNLTVREQLSGRFK